MALDETLIKTFIKKNLRISLAAADPQMMNLADSIVTDNEYINTIMELGGSQFYAEDWPFVKYTKEVTLTAGTANYKISDNSKLDANIDSVSGVRRLTSDDYGFDLTMLSEHEFNRKYPYVTSLSNADPMECKIYWTSGNMYMEIAPPPDSACTLEIDFKLGWNKDRLGLIPERFIHVFVQSCMPFAVPTSMKEREYYLWRTMMKHALQKADPDQSKKVIYEWPLDPVGPKISDLDRALNRVDGEY